MGTASQYTPTHPTRRPYCVRSVPLALWLMAKGFRPLGTEPARDGRGHVFLFTNEAADFADGYVVAKNEIDRLLMQANRQPM